MADATPTSDVPVRHDPAGSRFLVELDGEAAVLEYHRHGREVAFTHTEVPPSFEGRGVGSRLARAALDWAVGEKLAIVPQCPFVTGYLRRHREYHEHVARDWRGVLER